MKLKPNHFLSMRGGSQTARTDGKGYFVRSHRDRFFFPDEWMSFYDKLIGPKQKLTFNLLLNTGARIMEAQNIKVSDIDFDRNNIVLRVTKRVVARPKKGVVGKRRIRVVNMSRKHSLFLKKAVSFYKLGNDDYLPVLTTSSANIAMKKALKKAGIKDWDMFSLHNVRKTSEMWLLALGVDSFKVIKQFGHSTAVALKHYLSTDIFTWEEKEQMKQILGDIYGR